MPAEPLILDVEDYQSPDRWDWVLKTQGGALLARRSVRLDRSEEPYEGYLDLRAYLRKHRTPLEPERWHAEDTETLQRFGAWFGAALFGDQADRLVDQADDGPVTLRVRLPQTDGADQLMFRPWEAAHIAGQPLTAHDITLVFEIADGAPQNPARPVTDRLRMLAVFSLPPRESPLNLRRERQMLKRLVAELTGTGAQAAIELRVLQYGTSQAVLREAIDKGDGWDILHFSGHGTTGRLILETDDGSPDEIDADTFRALIRRARRRLKLVTLSACWSAASTVAETKRWLGLEDPHRDATGAAASAQPDPEAAPASATAPKIDTAIVRRLLADLDCAVLAMRFPVEDTFAMELGHAVYQRLFADQQPLPLALVWSLQDTTEARPDRRPPGPLSRVTPALFGRSAAALALAPPTAAETGFTVPATGLFGFPPEPEHFIGRVAQMTRASAALAANSGKGGVVFHGMAGAGKTACAVELAHHLEPTGRFQAFVFFKAPDEGTDIAPALVTFARALEDQVPGIQMLHLVDRTDELKRFLPRLQDALRRHAVLIVLDNLESLLKPAGSWWDARWQMLVTALLSQGGLSRTVLTSRIKPADLPAGTEVVPVHSLSLAEALLLMRQMPHLGRLIAEGNAEARGLARRTLRIVQGHPKLIAFAEAEAADQAALGAQVARAEAALQQDGAALDAFFRDGESRLDAAAFLTELATWTQGLTDTLDEPSRLLFHLLCCVEESDRISWILDANWADLWQHLEKPQPVPAWRQALPPLLERGLVEAQPQTEKVTRFALHPGVAQAGRKQAGAALQAAVDRELLATYAHMLQSDAAQTNAVLFARAGLAALPYALRLQQWGLAQAVIEWVAQRDDSPATLAVLLPLSARAVAGCQGTADELTARGVQANILLNAGRTAEAEQALRALIDLSRSRADFRGASVSTGALINLLRASGRAQEALALVEPMKDATHRAGLGPWTQLGDEAQRLQLLAVQGRHSEVLAAVETLRADMATVPERGDQEETANPWNVRETLLDTGRSSALVTEAWQTALELNAEIQASQQARGAGALEQAGTRFNDYGPLIRLGRLAEAQALLADCQAVFEAENHLEMLGKVLLARAELAARLGHADTAAGFERRALVIFYRVGDPDACAISHNNLASSLVHAGGRSATSLGHRLAAVSLGILMQSGHFQQMWSNLLRDLHALGDQADVLLPADFAALCRTVETDVAGVRFREMVETLAGHQGVTGDTLLQDILAQARAALAQAQAQAQAQGAAEEGPQSADSGPASAGPKDKPLDPFTPERSQEPPRDQDLPPFDDMKP